LVVFERFAVEKMRSFAASTLARAVSEMSTRDATAGAHVAQRGTPAVAQRSRARRARVAQLGRERAGLALALAVAGAALAACQKSPDFVDAGQERDALVPCTGATTCDGTAVRACRMGQTGEVIEECGPDGACSLGRCTTPPCAKAEEDRAAIVGCAFYTFDLDNVVSDEDIPTSVIVTNPGQVPATVTLERREGGASAPGFAWTGMSTALVPPMRSARFSLADSHFEGGGLAPRTAFRVTSDMPVSAAHIQSDDSTAGGSSSSGGTLLLPAHVLGTRYRAITYSQVATPELVATMGARGGAGQVVIVGAADGTQVTITPSMTSQLEPGAGVPPPGPDGKLHVTLDDGDLFTLFSDRDGADLTGSEISADHPIAVFSGNISTTYGITATGVSSPDLAHEQLLPVGVWATSFVAAHLPPQLNVCDSLFATPGSSMWTIVADRPGTQVHFSSPPGATPPPDRLIGAGEGFHFAAAGSFVVTASSPIQIMQGLDCEPSMSSAVPTATFLSDYTFGVLPGFDTWISIVRAKGDAVFLDSEPVAVTPEPANDDFEVLGVQLKPCSTTDVVCTHHLEGKFGLTMRGMDVLASWALTVPTWCIDSPTTNCIR
jgi:hypothetical protein